MVRQATGLLVIVTVGKFLVGSRFVVSFRQASGFKVLACSLVVLRRQAYRLVSLEAGLLFEQVDAVLAGFGL